LNARVINKLDVLRTVAEPRQPDIIGIAESWATNQVTDSDLHIISDDFFRCDRPRWSFMICKKSWLLHISNHRVHILSTYDVWQQTKLTPL
jgi:hypothetical protein